MANHDYVIDNGTGSTVRADLNSALQAILTNNSGNSAPSTTAQGQLWWDADGNTLYIRNTADNAWLEVGLLTATQTMTNKTLTSPDINGGTADDLTSLTVLADGTLKTSDGAILNLQTSDTTVTDGSLLGSVQFKAPAEDSGTDAILTGAEIAAVAEGTFAADNNATELVFKTGASEAAAEKMVLSSSGQLKISADNLLFGTASKGIYLGVSSPTASNLLSDYEEGTFTCTLKGTTSDPSSAVTTTGNYTKIGRLVYITVAFANVNTTGAAGGVRCTLPFTPSPASQMSGNVTFHTMATITSNTVNISPFFQASDVAFYQTAETAGAWSEVSHNAGTGRYLYFTGLYQT